MYVQMQRKTVKVNKQHTYLAIFELFNAAVISALIQLDSD